MHPAVTDNRDASRYEASLGSELAGFLRYRLRDGEITLIHTEVEPEFEGNGLGTALAHYALEDARARGIRVIPQCPFVLAYLRRHPEYRDVLEPKPASCSHLNARLEVSPSSSGCEDCERIGGTWVHLRLCLTCGHVGCCDSSPNRHASAHFREAGHPIVRSFEPGERWEWCYADEVTIEPQARSAAR